MAQQLFVAEAYRILLVDDNEINREVALAVLEPYGCQLSQAEGGTQAVELAREQDFDMILMDYLMPDMDGIEATRRIRAERGEGGPVIVALTADGAEDVRSRFRESGCQDFLTKPIDDDQLYQLLARWIPEEQRHPLDAPVETPEMTAEEIASLQIPGIDLETSGICHGKTKAQYLQLLSLYCLDGKKNGPVWKAGWESQVDGYRIWVHGLKSASANIGALELSALARAQEDAAKQGDVETIRSGISGLFTVYEKLLNDIAHVLEAQESAGAVEEDTLDSEQLQAGLRQALEALEDFRSKESAQIVSELLRHHIPDENRELLCQVKERLQVYEDDEAETLLRKAVFHKE
jgi:CheY-like chemotaxis protein/HPt (histidine-containing phosphotransfer) domain-containing protein